MDQVCKQVWDSSYHAWLDPTANPPKYGWRCLQAPAPQSTPQPAVGCPLPIRLSVDMHGRVVYGQGTTSLRTEPQGGVILKEPEGAQFYVTYGPVCGDLGNNWFRVVMDDGNNGWLPEGDAAGTVYWLEPYAGQPPVGVPTSVSNPAVGNCSGFQSYVGVGMRAQAVRNPTNLRSSVGTNQSLVRALSPGTQFTIIGGPDCRTAAWWNVRLDDGTQGWVEEGYPNDGYYIQQVVSQPTVTSVPPDQPPSAQYPDAQLPGGGIDLSKYCKDIGYDVEQHSNQDAHSFRCVRNQTVHNMDDSAWSKACFDVWGSARPYATLTNSTELGAWKCQSTPGSIDPYRPPVAPTATPMPQATNAPKPVQPQATPAQVQVDPCANAYNIVPNEGVGLVAYYPNDKVHLMAQQINCTAYIRIRYPNLDDKCGSGVAYTWASAASSQYCQSKGYQVDHNPKIGDIVVFDRANPPVEPKNGGRVCQGASWDSGHVAYVESVNLASNQIGVSEWHWAYGSPLVDHSGTQQKPRPVTIDQCLSFVHVPATSSQPAPASDWTTRIQTTWAMPPVMGMRSAVPTNIESSCSWTCSGGVYAIRFSLPAGHYIVSSIQFYSAYVSGTQPGWVMQSGFASSGTNDIVTYILSSQLVDTLGQKIGSGRIQNLNAWYMLYTQK